MWPFLFGINEIRCIFQSEFVCTMKRLGRCLVESVMMYGSELWVKNKREKKTSYRQSML
jgi:hypothetical protein